MLLWISKLLLWPKVFQVPWLRSMAIYALLVETMDIGRSLVLRTLDLITRFNLIQALNKQYTMLKSRNQNHASISICIQLLNHSQSVPRSHSFFQLIILVRSLSKVRESLNLNLVRMVYWSISLRFDVIYWIYVMHNWKCLWIWVFAGYCYISILNSLTL
jgi:hypothetical protein